MRELLRLSELDNSDMLIQKYMASCLLNRMNESIPTEVKLVAPLRERFEELVNTKDQVSASALKSEPPKSSLVASTRKNVEEEMLSKVEWFEKSVKPAVLKAISNPQTRDLMLKQWSLLDKEIREIATRGSSDEIQ